MKQFDSIFNKFAKKEGSQHIATRFALKGIEGFIKKEKIKTVFEFGIGIGTIPYLLGSLDNKILYYGTEDNEFCLNSIKENLPLSELNIEFNLLNKYEDFIGNIKFDLIIIDGKFENVDFIKKITHKKSIIFIEGDRSNQQEFINIAFPSALKSRVISVSKNQKDSPFFIEGNSSYEGGYTIFRLDTRFLSKVSWFKEKFETFIKYKIRMY